MFWKVPAHLAHATDSEAIGYFLREYLHSRCTLTSEYFMYNFKSGNQDMESCLPKIICIFGLNQKAMAAGRIVLIDRKNIGLNLLKNRCWSDANVDPDFKKLDVSYKNWFTHEVVPMSPK